MDSCYEELGGNMDAWVEEQLAASPEWAPEHYVSIRQRLEGDSPSADQDAPRTCAARCRFGGERRSGARRLHRIHPRADRIVVGLFHEVATGCRPASPSATAPPPHMDPQIPRDR